MKPDFRLLANSSLHELMPYQPGKPIEELEREFGITSAIKLASNENPLGPSKKAFAAALSVLPNMHIYPDGACFELKQALATFLSIGQDQITVGNGSENILELLMKAYLRQGDTAIISEYAFLTIPILLKSYGVNTTVVKAQHFGHHIPSMLNAVNEMTRVLFIVNPNNPTGTYINKTDFQLLMDNLPPHILVVIDEAYIEYISQADYPNTLAFLPHYPNLVITRTFSKVYGLAALRLGYAVSSPDIADMLNRARLPFNVNTIAAKAACAALLDHEHVEKSVTLNQQGMRQLEEGFSALSLSFIHSLGNFLTVDVHDATAVYQKLLLEGVIVRPLNAYNMPKHLRVTIGTKEQNERFLHSLQKIMS